MNAFTLENCRSVMNAVNNLPASSNLMEFSFPSPTELTTKLMQNPLYDTFGPSFGTMW